MKAYPPAMSMPTPPAAQPLYPHTMSGPATTSTEPEPVNVDALCDLFDRSMSPVLYLDRVLTDADRQAVFDQHQLVAELDVVRGVDALRKATPDEIADAEAAKEAAVAAPPKAGTSKTTSTTSA